MRQTRVITGGREREKIQKEDQGKCNVGNVFLYCTYLINVSHINWHFSLDQLCPDASFYCFIKKLYEPTIGAVNLKTF